MRLALWFVLAAGVAAQTCQVSIPLTSLPIVAGGSASTPLSLVSSGGTPVANGQGWYATSSQTWGVSVSVDATGLATVTTSAALSPSILSAGVGWSGTCGGASLNVTGIIQLHVSVNSSPVNAVPLIGIAPLTVNFGTTIQPLSPTYFWNFGDGTLAWDLVPVISHTYTTPGYYNSMLSVNSGGINSYPGPAITVLPAALSVSGVEPPFGSVVGGETVEVTGQGFLSGPLVLFGGVVPASVTVLSDTRIRCVTPAHPSAAGVGVQVSYFWGAASSPTPFEYVPVIEWTWPLTLSPTAPTTLAVHCQGVGPASTLLVNGVAVPSTPTSTGLSVTLSPAQWNSVGAAALQVTRSGTTGFSSRTFIVPGPWMPNHGSCSGNPLGANPSGVGWVEVKCPWAFMPVTLVADFASAPVYTLPPPTPFIVGVGGPYMQIIFDGLGAFGSQAPALLTGVNGDVGMSVTVPAIAAGAVMRLQAAYLDPTSAIGYGVTWISSFSF